MAVFDRYRSPCPHYKNETALDGLLLLAYSRLIETKLKASVNYL